jgi:hypothetical protein
VTDVLTDLLIHPDVEIRHEAARIIWKCSDASLEGVFSILGSQGILPSVIAPKDAWQAVRTLQDHCPPERRHLFEPLVLGPLGSIIYEQIPNFFELAVRYEEVMKSLARFFIWEHGNLGEVRCVSGHDPCRIELVFADGHEVVVGDHSGDVDITMMKFGYRGTGPSCFHAFLSEAGFNITDEQVSEIEAGTILRLGDVR